MSVFTRCLPLERLKLTSEIRQRGISHSLRNAGDGVVAGDELAFIPDSKSHNILAQRQSRMAQEHAVKCRGAELGNAGQV
jgi:hypothetical protein